MMMHVQLRRFLPDAITPAEVLDVQEIQFAGAGSATKTVTFKTSLVVGEGIRDWIETNPGKAFIVAVEYSVDGGQWVEPRNGRFVAYKGAADDADPTETMSITCMDWMSWQLARTYLHWSTSAKNGERVWVEPGDSPASAGYILHGMITESKARGWGPQVGRDFTGTADSAGVAWTASDKVKQPWRLLTPLSQVLQSLTEQGLCDWWAEGTTLRLFRPGAGVDRSEVVLGGAGFSRAPGEWDFSGVFTNLTVVPEKARYWLYLENTNADESFGRLEATMTQSGVEDHPTATKLAQPTLVAGRAAKREQSYEWTVAGDMPRPWVDFNEHDLVTIDTAFGRRLEQVVELVVRVRDDVVTCVAVTGDRMISAVARRDRRAQSAVIGTIIGGSGNGIPGASVPLAAAPAAPSGLHIVSNVGSWRADGTAQATVVLGWDAVTQTVDGAAVDVAGYEIAHRLASSAAVIESVDGVTFTATAWEPGIERYVKVRAIDQTGTPSEWSVEIAVIPVVPPSIVPKAPTGLAVTSNTAVFQADGSAVATVVVGWDAVTLSVDDAPVEIAEYEVSVGLDRHRVTGLSASFTVPAGGTVDVTVRARSTLGVWGDTAPVVPVTGALPTAIVLTPSDPILTSGLGVLSIRWDGLLADATPPPPGSGFVYADVRDDDLDDWEQVGTRLTEAGTFTFRSTVGAAPQVRFRFTDTLGRPSGTSQVVSIPVTGVTGPDIEADTITGNNMRAGTLEVMHVSPTFGDDLNLSANESVTIIVGRQNDQAAQLVDMDSGVTAAQAAADAAQTVASDVSARLDEHQTYYRFGVDGLAIGDPAEAAELRLKPDRIEMTQNNVIVSYWEGGVFVADEARLNSAAIGNHQFMAYGAGRTIVRPL